MLTAIFAALAALSVSACTALPTGSSNPPSPAPTVTVTAAPEARSADSPLEAVDGYALCRAVNATTFGGDASDMVWNGFDDSFVEPIDERWRVYIETTSFPNADGVPFEGAAFCEVGGTIGNVEWNIFGGSERFDPTDETAWNLEGDD